MPDIQSAVGRQPALNSVRDQQTVQDLLNRISADKGGPVNPLRDHIRANFVSSSLQAAIVRFQAQNVDPPNRDGRVDRIGQTIRKLNELATGGSSPSTQKHVSIHRKPVAPPGLNPPLAPDLQPQVEITLVVDDLNKAADAYRAQIRQQLIGNSNAAAVERFLDSAPKSAFTGLPIHPTARLFGRAGLNSASARLHTGTELGVGSRVGVLSDDDSRPVILFAADGGTVVIGPGTLFVVLSDRPQNRNLTASDTKLVLNTPESRRKIGELAGPRKPPK